MAAMKMLMGPALALMNKLTTPQKMLASALAFTLPVGIVVYALIVSGVAWQDPAILLIGGGYVLAVYSTLGHHFQVLTTFGGLQNAALVEQATASTLAFEEQAANLIAAIRHFKATAH